MSHHTGLRVGMAWLLACAGALSADAPVEMAPQPQVAMTQASSGTWKTAWQGVPGRTYLMQWSDDLVNWNYLPLTDAGAGTKAYGGASSTNKFFVRLFCSDETPDLAKSGIWEPPLLRIGGAWTVVTTHRDASPAVGVRLSLYRWPAASAAPLTAPLLVATTSADGTYTFDPSALGTDNRVEVRITGSPNQRVYLPWKDGHEPEPGTISPGGDGMTLTGLLGGSGTGQTPDYAVPPSGGEPPAELQPVFRLEDYLTLDGNGHHVFPLGLQFVQDQYSDSTGYHSDNRQTADDTTNWRQPFILGYAKSSGGQIILSDNYQAQMSVAFGDPDLEINVKRNILILSVPRGEGCQADTPSVANLNQGFTLKDGVVSDLSSNALPYMAADFGAGQAEAYMRQLVLGPVPMYVPKSVLGGKPFFYNELGKIEFHSELPLGCNLKSNFSDPSAYAAQSVPARILWTATVTGTNNCYVKITDESGQFSGEGQSVTFEAGCRNPHIYLSFISKLASDILFDEPFSVTLSAQVKIATATHPPGEGQTNYTYDYTTTDLGSFTTDFKFSAADNSPTALAQRQPAQLHGLTGNTPEGDGFNGGQRSKTLEPERRIGVNGLPAPASPTFVDALTGRFHHSEADFSLAIPGSDLSLSVNRSASESIWTNAFGLRPTENPLLAFGPGWDTNLSASLQRVISLQADGSALAAAEGGSRLLRSTITVRDYQGGAFGFLEYTNGDGVTSYIPDPTMLPERGTAGISLTADTNGNVLTLVQPQLGLTHVFAKTTVDFQIPNNRDTPTTDGQNPSGYTCCQYYRLTSVTDRFGVQLSYQYGDSSPQNLIPQLISVVGRSALQLRIQQSDGRIQAFWDPSGIKHTYTYEGQTLIQSGGGAAASCSKLTHHKIGPLTAASYGYQYVTEADPRPASMLLQTTDSAAYTIPTYHIALNSIANGIGNAVTINYQLSHARSSYASTTDNSTYHPAGDPLLVQSIVLPNAKSVAFDLQHTLKNGQPAIPATGGLAAVAASPPVLSIFTGVTDVWGNHWNYSYATPTCYPWMLTGADTPYLPSASALFFPKLTRSCTEVADSFVEYNYDATAGFELSLAKDAANRTSGATHNEAFTRPASPYSAPQVSTSARIHDHYALPSTTTDVLGHTTTYHYVSGGSNPLKLYLPDTITDSRQRIIALDRDALARTLSIKLLSASNDFLSEMDFTYGNGNFPGALTKTTRKIVAGANDPAWVADLVKDTLLDAYGFASIIGNDAANLHTTITRSPAGRVLAVQSPNGSTRSNIYDSSGLLEATWLEDGSNLTYQHDPAGRTVLTRDALGHATAIEYDSMGRIVTAVRDLDGNLSYSPATGLEGVDATTDIVSRATYQDETHEVHLTDPRGYISVRVLDALNRTTKLITPHNECAPGTVPTEAADFVTSFTYDLLQSPSQPVKITDPLSFETLFKFDGFARLEKILRQYGSGDANNKLYSGTFYGFDDASGLPNSITSIRTPLDSEGATSGPDIQSITSSITYDVLDRPQTSVFAEGTDKEIQTRTTYTSTGIRYKDETRDALAPAEHWSAREIECDALGRPVTQYLPEVTDALTDEPDRPTTRISYDAWGEIHQLTDSYGNATTFGQDVLGNLAYKKSPAVVDAKSGLTLEPTTIYRYDPVGRLDRVVDPLGYAWSYEHDAAGRLTKTTSPIVRPEANPAHRQAVWQYFHDPAGNLTQAIDPEGHSTTRIYYPNNLLASLTTPVTEAIDAASPVNVIEQYHRDALGRISRVVDGNNQATAFTHDGLGRTLTTTRDPDDTARAKTETTAYDALLPLASVDAKNQRKEYLYNSQFRLEHLNVIGATGESLTYLYDLLGRVTSIAPTTTPTDFSMGNPNISRSYDVLGRLESETSNGVTTTHGYDLLNNVAKVTTSLPDTSVGRALAIQHDALSRTTRVADTTNGATLVTTFGHDLAGNQVWEGMSNGLAQASDFDPVGRVTSQRVSNASGNVLCKNVYQYDLLSNVTHIEESAAALNVPNRIIDNTYNERSQLLTEIQSDANGTTTRSEVHRYDSAENRVSTTVFTPFGTLTRLFEYGSPANGLNSNQIYQLTETPGSGDPAITTYNYDANGNRTEKVLTQGGTGGPPVSATDTYAYDTFNRLTQLSLNTSNSAENGTYNYAYDPLTRRISRSVGDPPIASIHQFAFSGNTPVHEWDAATNDGSLVSNIGGGVGGRLYTQDADGLTNYPFHNARGDVIAQFSGGGSMTYHATYAASGMLQAQAGTRAGNYGTNGKWEEPGGLINDGFRYRDRLTETFITPDPAGFIDGPNTYNYVGHNPWSAWDPNGLSEQSYMFPASTSEIGYKGNLNGAIAYVRSLQERALGHARDLGERRSATFEAIEEAYIEFAKDYGLYLKSLNELQNQMFDREFDWRSRWFNSDGLRHDWREIGKLRILPDDDAVASALPSNMITDALKRAQNIYILRAQLYDVDIETADGVTRILESEQKLVNYAGAALGGAGIAKGGVIILLETKSLRAGVVYLTKAGVAMATGFIVAAGSEMAIDGAEESGYVTPNQAECVRLGIAAFQAYLAHRAMALKSSQSSPAAETGSYKPGEILPDGRIAGMGPGASLNNQATREAANALKFDPISGSPFNSHGQPVFKRGNRYITPDVDQHKGGVWKMFDQKGRRLGTYDENLNRIGD